jgi:hypothetical protein
MADLISTFPIFEVSGQIILEIVANHALGHDNPKSLPTTATKYAETLQRLAISAKKWE